MAKVRLYYRQVWDENGNLHEIKTASVEELSNFMNRISNFMNRISNYKKRNGESIKGYNQGSRMIPESRLQHCIDNVSIEDLMTLKKEDE